MEIWINIKPYWLLKVIHKKRELIMPKSFARVAMLNTIKLMIAISIKYKWKVH